MEADIVEKNFFNLLIVFSHRYICQDAIWKKNLENVLTENIKISNIFLVFASFRLSNCFIFFLLYITLYFLLLLNHISLLISVRSLRKVFHPCASHSSTSFLSSKIELSLVD